MGFKAQITVALFLISTLLQRNVLGNPDTFTREEKVALHQFRSLVKDLVYMDYMKEDWYLIHWLRAKNLDIKKAKEMLGKSLKWRKENGIDDLINNGEMKSWMVQKFPASLDAIDKEGRPVLQAAVGLWDIRKAMLAGQRRALAKYLDFLHEFSGIRIQEQRNVTRADVSQNILLLDLSNYSRKQHGCAACLPFFHDLITHYEHYYPAQSRHILLINTPQFFQTVLDFMRPFMSAATRRDLKIYRNDKAVWGPAILKIIPANQLTPQYGGTKKG